MYFFLTPRRGLLKKLSSELPERFTLYGKSKASGLIPGPLWLHAASVGETKSILALTAELKKEFPDRDIILTTSTTAGKEAARKNPHLARVLLAPLDFYPFTKHFMNVFRPSAIIVIESELWPNMLCAAHAGGLATAIVNGRLSAKSARTYAKVKPLAEKMLGGLSLVCAQTPDIAARYEKLGVDHERVLVTGNIKYDLLTDHAERKDEAAALLARLGWTGKHILVCGSTHPVEEELLARTFAAIAEKVPDYRLITAPRHLERAEQTENVFKQAGIPCARFTTMHAAQDGAKVFIADTMGLLVSLYSQSTACFIGGTIAPRGGHNILEAAIMGKPVLFGPSTHNTPDAAALLEKTGGGFRVNQENLPATLIQLFSDVQLTHKAGEKARAAAQSFRGATEKTIAAIKCLKKI